MSSDQVPNATDDVLDTPGDTQSRRALLRRSLLGVGGVGLAAMLAACGGDDDDDGEDAVDTIESEGEDAVDEVESEGEDAVDEIEDEVDDESD
jgi:hypothetical protein